MSDIRNIIIEQFRKKIDEVEDRDSDISYIIINDLEDIENVLLESLDLLKVEKPKVPWVNIKNGLVI